MALDLRILIGIAPLLAAACGQGGSETPAGASPAAGAVAQAPATVAELIERSRQTLGQAVRTFDLVESKGGEIVRTGRLTTYPADSRAVFDLVWEAAGEKSRVRSDGETIVVEREPGKLTFASWSEAGSALYSREAGKLLGAALDPSSFTAYGAALGEAPAAGSMLLQVGLPSGGGWALTISRETWLPESISFRPALDADVERLDLEPRRDSETLPVAALGLGPGDRRIAEPFYLGPAPGDPAPNITFTLASGDDVTLADLRGSVVVIDFWATWCVPCRPAMKKLEELHRRHRGSGLAVYGLRLFDSGDPTAYLESLGITYPIGDGSPFIEPYAVGAYGLPSLYVIDRDGRIAKLIVGFSAEIEAVLEAAVVGALES